VAELQIDRYKLKISGESFQTKLVSGEEENTFLEPDSEYYSLEIPDEAREHWGAGADDFAPVKQEKSPDQEGFGVVGTSDEQEFGRFTRDDEGHIEFICFANARVIGSEDISEDFQFGYITALLEPA
jgi:hypothetical protein